MTPVSQWSSSNSWSRSGADAMPAPDIIDLDRYMRTARPQAPPARRDGERLVVDSGGGSGARNKAGGCSSYKASCAKRYSHDSGLSDDGSYGPRQREAGRINRRGTTSRDAPRAADSTHSMRKFRVACERALREQQQQISRVAQLCDRLTTITTPLPQPSPPQSPAQEPSLSSDSSDSTYTSRSRSARDRRRKDNIRSDECKTYKIIMTKLDELSRMFVARGRLPAQVGGCSAVAAAMARRPRADLASSGSVLVSDKIVATEPEPQLLTPQTPASFPVATRHAVERAVGHSQPSSLTRVQETHGSNMQQPDSPRRICQAQHGDTVHRSVRCSSTEEIGCSVLSDRRRITSAANDFEQVYSEPKRVHSCRRVRSAENHREMRRPRGSGSGAGSSGKRVRRSSLCGMCRSYWRALTNCIATQIFYRPTTA